MLSDVVATLLPHHTVAGLEHAVVDGLDTILIRAEGRLESIAKPSSADDAELLRTLSVVLDRCMKIWPADLGCLDFQNLSRAIDLREREGFPGA